MVVNKNLHSPLIGGDMQSDSGLFSPYEFPCGSKIRNRLVKAPMYEHLTCWGGGAPNAYHLALYSTWSRYDWGMIITGNVQVFGSHLTLGRDLVVPDHLDDTSLKSFENLAKASKGPDGHTLAIMQLSHAGRQSPNLLGGRYPFMPPSAPSSIPIGLRTTKHDLFAAMIQKLLFQTPKELTLAEIDDIAEKFVQGAHLAHLSGFDGIELHVAHGYLLAQFLSPKSNKRQDQYSLQSENGLRFLHQIVDGIRAACPPQFIVGVKLNSSEYIADTVSKEQNRVISHVLALASWSTVDFIEISGGDYESPAFMARSLSTSGRQAFFTQFSQKALKSLDSAGFMYPSRPAIIVTGGFRTPNLLYSALRSGHTDMLGIGRCSIVCPQIPNIMRDFEQRHGNSDGDIPFGAKPDFSTSDKYLKRWPIAALWNALSKIKLIGAGFDLAWYTITLRQLAIAELRRLEGHRDISQSTQEPDYAVDALWTLFRVFFWLPNTSWRRPLHQFTAGKLVASVGFLSLTCFYLYWQY